MVERGGVQRVSFVADDFPKPYELSESAPHLVVPPKHRRSLTHFRGVYFREESDGEGGQEDNRSFIQRMKDTLKEFWNGPPPPPPPRPEFDSVLGAADRMNQDKLIENAPDLAQDPGTIYATSIDINPATGRYEPRVVRKTPKNLPTAFDAQGNPKYGYGQGRGRRRQGNQRPIDPTDPFTHPDAGSSPSQPKLPDTIQSDEVSEWEWNQRFGTPPEE